MSTQERDQLQRDMAEAAALPAGDPRRQEVIHRVQEAGAWAEDKWVALLDVDERLRVELPRVSVSVGLEERLLAIPEEFSLSRRSLRRWSITAAAGLVLVCGGLAVLFLSGRGPTQRIHQIGLTAIGDHMFGQQLTIETSDEPALIAALKPQVHFDIKLPQLGQGFHLLGGRKCSFGRHTAVYTRWERDGYEYSLYQFCPKDFGLPREFSRRTVVSDDGGTDGECDALIWTENDCAYVLVAKRDAFVPNLTVRASESDKDASTWGAAHASAAPHDRAEASPRHDMRALEF
ncbi:hypothetical protein LCGC14_0302130 [marine sediment metagenome]|uniref:Uncharacterized protein n=1 Tax=marine sediment metagenome TaxID=412755 RepID=A0A0F9TPV5_9ZZZZ|nr:hypothetical protein [Phycisphaerae bacterium]HDZ45168.1 hypothetical protein [Phycisphaerae bacterium]